MTRSLHGVTVNTLDTTLASMLHIASSLVSWLLHFHAHSLDCSVSASNRSIENLRHSNFCLILRSCIPSQSFEVTIVQFLIAVCATVVEVELLRIGGWEGLERLLCGGHLSYLCLSQDN